MLPILAQVGGVLAAGFGGYSFVQIAITIVVVLAVVALVVIFCRQTGLTIPPFLINVLWVVLAAVVVIVAIKFVAAL